MSLVSAEAVSGILKASRFKHITLLEARVDTVSHTVWNTVNFILNGSVFVILGMELEMIAKPILSSPIYNNLLSNSSGLSVDSLALFDSFCHGLPLYWFRNGSTKKIVEKLSKRCLIADFSGCEGNGFDCDDSFDSNQDRKRIPYPTLLVAGVTLVSFIAGLVVLPKLSEEKEETNDYLMQIAILNDVVSGIRSRPKE